MSDASETRVLKPALLVVLRTSVRGGVVYERDEIEPEHRTDSGAQESRWETTKRIEDPDEYERAIKVRGRCISVVRSACIRSDFGLLCLTDREPKLTEAIKEARRLADDFNERARETKIAVNIIRGRVASNDLEAAQSIASEIRDLMDEMRLGVENADVERIRAAATRAKGLGQMVPEESSAKVASAIKEARAAAREITKRVTKSGEDIAAVVTGIKLEAISAARFAFIELEEGAVESKPIEAPALDLEPEAHVEAPAAPKADAPLDIEKVA